MGKIEELKEWSETLNKLATVYDSLPDLAATIAVNFSKERFRQQNWVDRSTLPWKKRKHDRASSDASRAILVKSGRLKRDVHKIYVGKDIAIIGTSKLTGAYAKAHNEGFKGTVTVKEFSRSHYTHVKEKYKTRTGRERTRTRKTVNPEMKTKVRMHTRKINLVKRQFLGQSVVMDTQIERGMAAALIKALK